MVDYLSKGLVSPELRYSYVEKLVLAEVHAVQKLRHSILIHNTIFLADVNPM